MGAPPPPIVVCADAALWGTRRCLDIIERLTSVAPRGTLGVWDRDPESSPGATPLQERLARLEALRGMTRGHGHQLFVGARVDLAMATSADGVHLPEHGIDVASVRASFPDLTVSRSCHDRAGLLEAEMAGASWATLSPFRAPRSKTSALPPLGERAFNMSIEGLRMPVLALGGLGLHEVTACKLAGAGGLALSGAIFESDRPERLLEDLIAAWFRAL